jgi:hypothetical protein
LDAHVLPFRFYKGTLALLLSKCKGKIGGPLGKAKGRTDNGTIFLGASQWRLTLTCPPAGKLLDLCLGNAVPKSLARLFIQILPGGYMPEEKNFFAGLVDFSFQQQIMRRIVRVLYIIGILVGGICVVTYVVLGFQNSPAEGLINLVAGIVSFFVGLLIWRVLLELALLAQRIAESIDRATH